MENDYKLSTNDVVEITKDFCELMDGEDYITIYKHINLLDNNIMNDYIVLFCCRKEDAIKIMNQIDFYKGKNKDQFIINKDCCHIATYKSSNNNDFISFNDNDECNIHAKFNKEFSCIEDFFIKYLKYKNNLNNNDYKDDINKYYLEFKKGFIDNSKDSVFNIIKNKIKRR